MTTAAIDTAKLAVDIAAARVSARAAAQGEDGGTCNMDSPMLFFGGMPRVALRRQIEAVVGSGTWGKLLGCPGFIFSPGCGGQGNSRNRAAEAIAKELRARGWDCGVYYVMD